MKYAVAVIVFVATLAVFQPAAQATIAPHCGVGASTSVGNLVLFPDVVVTGLGSYSCVKAPPGANVADYVTRGTVTLEQSADQTTWSAVASAPISKGCSYLFRPPCGTAVRVSVTLSNFCPDPGNTPSVAYFRTTVTAKNAAQDESVTSSVLTVDCREFGGGD
jgi:hypothetical protein